MSCPTFSLFITPPLSSSKYSAPNSSLIACHADSPGLTTVMEHALPLSSCCRACGLLRKADCASVAANRSNCKVIEVHNIFANIIIYWPITLTIKMGIADDEAASLFPLSLQQFFHRRRHSLGHAPTAALLHASEQGGRGGRGHQTTRQTAQSHRIACVGCKNIDC
ncbi:hypothetical protein PRIPAC_91494 [Pristionchus pacificus]|uniref:Uncharacterized protein n=1 Tax=Pristionchus pacificus TaxID=54126 RepID=A0A2A6CIK9_PRIPA|nr:hypothetical protein PRIPAC_91494 [Pristionchus pacificus]|eukprot:PDM77851.1 hypothetical protein PRIPAC_34718 [Pristionchus pacificus]